MSAKTAVLSDIHGNSPALRAVLDHVRREGCERIIVLGDVVNGVDPGGCLDLLAGRGDIIFVKGNAEFHLLTPDLNAFPLREESLYTWYIPLVEWWRQRVPAAHLGMLRAMHERVVIDGTCFVHDDPIARYSPEGRAVDGLDAKYWEFCYHAGGIREADVEERRDELLSFMEARGFSRLFLGHTHEPYLRTISGRLICNVGSVGVPLDGDTCPSWATCELGEGSAAKVELRRTEYDLTEMLRKIDALDPGCALFYGGRTKETYREMFRTGIHWKVHAKREQTRP